MRALSIVTLTVFLFMFAAHLSWWQTSRAISSKIKNKGRPIFSGPHLTQVEKLDQLSELKKQPESPMEKVNQQEDPKQQEEVDLDKQLLSPNVNLSELRSSSPEEGHLLKRFAEQFSRDQVFDEATVKNILLTKGYSQSGPEAKALLATLERLKEDPSLRKENYTDVFFRIYEEIAFDPNSYDNHYEMREALSRMNFKRDEIDEFEEGLYEEETYKY